MRIPWKGRERHISWSPSLKTKLFVLDFYSWNEEVQMQQIVVDCVRYNEEGIVYFQVMLYTDYADIRNITEKFGRKTFDANASYDEGMSYPNFLVHILGQGKEQRQDTFY